MIIVFLIKKQPLKKNSAGNVNEETMEAAAGGVL